MLRILIALDGSELSEKALLHGEALGRCFESELVLLQVIEQSGIRSTVDSVDWQLHRQQASAYLQRQVEKLQAHDLNASYILEEGNVAERIMSFASQDAVDLIILGAHGHSGAGQFSCGGIAQKVVQAASTSIMVSPTSTSNKQADAIVYKSVLVPVRGSKGCQWTVNTAAAIAAVHGAELILMQAIERPQLLTSFADPREKRDLLEQYVRICRREATGSMQELKATLPSGLKVSTEIIVTDNASVAIDDLANARDVSLIAMGAHSRARHNGWHYGMIPEFMLTHASRPVLVFQHDDRIVKSNFRSIYLHDSQAHAS